MYTEAITLGLFSVAFIGYKSLVVSKKLSLIKSTDALTDIYEIRKRQRAMLGDLASDYFNSITINGHRALAQLDRLLGEVHEVLEYSQLAIDSSSLSTMKQAKRAILKFHKEMEDSIDSITVGMADSQVRKLKATWEFKAQELVELIADEISGSSTKCKTLGYKVPSGRSTRKPTDLALQELRELTK